MPVSDTALVVIAVAVTLQTLIIAVALVAGLRAWRQATSDVRDWQVSLERRFDAVSSRIDEVVIDARLAARSVENLATRADGPMQDAATAAHTVKTAVTAPKALLLSGAASAARWLLGRRRSPFIQHNAHPGASGADIF
jgi:hypothetical protein